MNTTDILNKIANLNNIAAEYTKNNKQFFNGTIYPTAVLAAIAQYGAENIIQYGENYHGLHEDDYCSFNYLNNVTGEVFVDGWTTAAACPNFSLYQCLSVYEAIELGIKLHDSFHDYNVGVIRSSCEKNLQNYTAVCTYNITPQTGRKVFVKGGRKFKGEGYLVEVRKDSFYTRYREVTSHVAVIFNPETNEIREANASLAYYADVDEFNSEYMQWVEAKIEGASDIELVPNYGSLQYDFVSKYHPCVFYREYIKRHPMPSTEGAAYPEQEKRDAKLAEKRTKKRTQLEAWAAKFTDKTDEEREYMIERALAKQGF